MWRTRPRVDSVGIIALSGTSAEDALERRTPVAPSPASGRKRSSHTGCNRPRGAERACRRARSCSRRRKPGQPRAKHGVEVLVATRNRL